MTRKVGYPLNGGPAAKGGGADSGVVDSGSALYPTAVHAPTRVPSAAHFLRTASPYSSALHRLCLLAV